MKSIALYLGVLLCAGIVVATAAAQVSLSDSAKLKSGDPARAVVDVKGRFTAIDSACFAFTFAPGNGLDPGESLRVTPDAWLRENPSDRGPGFVNVGAQTVYSRTLCVPNYPGQPLDRLLAELVDGKEHVTLNADDGPVTVTDLVVTITGTQ